MYKTTPKPLILFKNMKLHPNIIDISEIKIGEFNPNFKNRIINSFRATSYETRKAYPRESMALESYQIYKIIELALLSISIYETNSILKISK